jgi:hypothetical protein
MSAAIERLRSAVRTLPGLLAGFSEAESEQRPSPERWMKKEVLGHLIDSASNNHQSWGTSITWGITCGRCWAGEKAGRHEVGTTPGCRPDGGGAGGAAHPVAEQEAHVLLFEPASTLHTGNVRNERTVAHLDRI